MTPARLAIIADIHGNVDALNAVLSDVQQQGADALYINGDVVNRGPDSVAALQTLLALRPEPTFVLGNHDDLMRLWLRRDGALPGDWFEDPFWAATSWSAQQLEQAGLLDVIAQWPMTHRVQHSGLPDVLLAHGTAEHYRESLGRRMSEERLRRLLDDSGAGIVVGSHTHDPMLRRVEGQESGPDRWAINTGAVGAPFNGDARAQYLLLEAGPAGWQPILRAVPYDRSGVLQRFESSGLLREGGVSAEIFRHEVELARSLYTPYWMWTEAQELARTPQTWQQFQRLFPERFEPVALH